MGTIPLGNALGVKQVEVKADGLPQNSNESMNVVGVVA